MARLPLSSHHEPDIDGWTMVDARSSGRLVVPGQWSTENPPRFEVEVTATNKSSVSTVSEQLGAPERYAVVVSIENRNDSPAFVRVTLKS